MHEFGVPIVFDVTHSLQLPEVSDMQPAVSPNTSNRSHAREWLAEWMRFHGGHECPERAPSDGPKRIATRTMEALLFMLRDIQRLVKSASNNLRVAAGAD